MSKARIVAVSILLLAALLLLAVVADSQVLRSEEMEPGCHVDEFLGVLPVGHYCID